MASKSTKRKHVIHEVLNDFVLPEQDQMIVKILASCGNNLHQVVDGKGEEFLVSMPTKFRRNVWVRKGSYVIATPIEEGDKVKAEISVILYKEQIKYIQDSNKWPAGFQSEEPAPQSKQVDDDMLPPSYSDSEEEEELTGAGNPNRPSQLTQYDSGDSDSDAAESH